MVLRLFSGPEEKMAKRQRQEETEGEGELEAVFILLSLEA